jgi:hypothetical protein
MLDSEPKRKPGVRGEWRNSYLNFLFLEAKRGSRDASAPLIIERFGEGMSLAKGTESCAGLVCRGCHVAIPVVSSSESTPPKFRMRCPNCGDDSRYHRHEIREFTLHRE